jgi:hypothetical protein
VSSRLPQQRSPVVIKLSALPPMSPVREQGETLASARARALHAWALERYDVIVLCFFLRFGQEDTRFLQHVGSRRLLARTVIAHLQSDVLFCNRVGEQSADAVPSLYTTWCDGIADSARNEMGRVHISPAKQPPIHFVTYQDGATTAKFRGRDEGIHDLASHCASLARQRQNEEDYRTHRGSDERRGRVVEVPPHCAPRLLPQDDSGLQVVVAARLSSGEWEVALRPSFAPLLSTESAGHSAVTQLERRHVSVRRCVLCRPCVCARGCFLNNALRLDSCWVGCPSAHG